MEHPRDTCQYCQQASAIQYHYLPLADKVCSNKDFCKKITEHWDHRRNWLNDDAMCNCLNEIWDGKRFGILAKVGNYQPGVQFVKKWLVLTILTLMALLVKILRFALHALTVSTNLNIRFSLLKATPETLPLGWMATFFYICKAWMW